MQAKTRFWMMNSLELLTDNYYPMLEQQQLLAAGPLALSNF